MKLPWSPAALVLTETAFSMVSEPGPGKPWVARPQRAAHRGVSAILRWAGRLERLESGEITCLGQKGRWRGLEPRLKRAAGGASRGRTLGGSPEAAD